MDRRCSTEHRQETRQFQQLTGCDIVKRGTLYVKHPPSFLPAAFTIQVCIMASVNLIVTFVVKVKCVCVTDEMLRHIACRFCYG